MLTLVLFAERQLSFTMGLDYDPSFNSPTNELYQYTSDVVSSDLALMLKVDTKKQRSLNTMMLLTDPEGMQETHSRTARCNNKRVSVSSQVKGNA